MNIPKRELTSLADSVRDIFTNFDHASMCIQMTLPKTKVEIGSTKSKVNLFAHHYNDIIEHPKKKFVYHSDLKTTILAYFLSETLNQFTLTEIANLSHRQIQHLYKNRHYVANKCEILGSNYDV